MKKDLRYVIFKIADDKSTIVADCEGEKEKTYDDCIALLTGEPRYALIDCPEIDTLILLVYIPDDCGVKQRMLYASSVDVLKKKLPGVKVVHANDKADCAYDEASTK